MKKTVLVVDSDEEVREMFRVILEMFGHGSIICENSEQAIPHIYEADTLITDFSMLDGINGAELAKVAKNQKPDMQVLILTNRPDLVPKDNSADNVFSKPVDVHRIYQLL